MRDVPIIFSAPMVRALLDGRKTQTRRLATSPLAKVQPGDRLWVRENTWQNGTWVRTEDETGEIGSKWVGTSSVRMMADETKPAGSGNFVWRSIPSIHMPRWASRLTLVVEQVRVERLQDITREDVYAEGAITDEWLQWREDAGNIGMPEGSSIEDERDVFARLWTSLHGADAWSVNPWVVALTFAVHRSNIDKLEAREVADA
ncbi:hypothetical protein [Azospirillum brasilense]|uniref:hypothetical protein n=1 Tax=Azospirillum brasilense TaxID=192 RepID=UPI001EDA245C|nr:hypothetical protein [Azospirillum brasilense]UKJ74571.1 hypothetical protein H1Q64_18610 [Azospirillum brasilense]